MSTTTGAGSVLSAPVPPSRQTLRQPSRQSSRQPHPQVRPALAAGSQDDLRRANLAQVLGLVHTQGPLTRAEITSRLGLNRSTIAGLVTELSGACLVSEVVSAERRGAGRPSHLVRPELTAAAVAVDVATDHLTVALVGLGGTVLAVRTRRRRRRDIDPAAARKAVRTLLQAVLAAVDPGIRVVGVAASVPGVVRMTDGLVHEAPNLEWRDVPWGWVLSELTGHCLPVSVANDADLGVIAEHVRGAGAGFSDVLFVTGGRGVGGGFVVGGRPLAGAGGYAGEVGHMVVNPAGRACGCGRRGCWETEVAEQGLLHGITLAAGAATGTAGSPATASEVFAAARRGDPGAQAQVEKVAYWLGMGTANLVHLLNPEVVVFGGVLADIFEAAPQQVNAQLLECLDGPREQVLLRGSALGKDSVLLGAAEVALAPLLADPLSVAKAPEVRRLLPALA